MMSEEKDCHKCLLLNRDYDKGVMHEKTFLYYCNGNWGVTTHDLKKGCRYE